MYTFFILMNMLLINDVKCFSVYKDDDGYLRQKAWTSLYGYAKQAILTRSSKKVFKNGFLRKYIFDTCQ